MISELNFIEPSVLVAFVLACAAIAIVPGPTVTVIIANSLKYGTRAGLLNVAGTQLGMIIMVVLVSLGLNAISTFLASMFDWLRLAGAAYLVWLGIKLLRSDGTLGEASNRARPGGSFFWQGCLVVLSNPKALLFLGAFIPQFVQSGQGGGNAAVQTFLLGITFMVVATTLDCVYAFTAGKVGSLLSKRNVRAVEIGGGSFMIAGGLWLALRQN